LPTDQPQHPPAGPSPQALPSQYDPHAIEAKWYALWEESGIFRADPASEKPPFAMVIPPPNITGSLHIGHALNNTLQDILCRHRRMQGADVLWVPGCDHAGIATQNVVERQLAAEGLTRQELGREKFLERIWEWKRRYGGTIMHQLRKLGCSLDWSRERFTLDPGLSEAVKEVFIRLHAEGLIYQGDYIINWCPRCHTALSDIETEYQDTAGHFWFLRYPLAEGDGEVVVATTRPETMLGDTAVAVHPEDDRYRALVGKKVRLPLLGREIPVIADTYVDRAFGTGAVKITPAHDPNDFWVGERHGLERINVLNPDGTLNQAAGPYAGLDRFEGRKRVLQDLEAEGYLVKVEEHEHAVGHCYRCHTLVEPYLSRQWFVKMKPLAEPAIRAYDEGRLSFTPAAYGKVFRDWLENIRDWCISRQIWWGHRIPVWTCDACGEVHVAKKAPAACQRCGHGRLRQDSDVLDTWFSSALWPFSTLGWPESTPELKKYYPTSVLVTSWDIIFFWVARMAMLGLKFMGDVPFRRVCINSLVGDAQGKKMSKSKGNTVDPLDIMIRTGADGLRFTMAAIENQSRYVAFTPDRLESARTFMNKIWNAARFALLNLEDFRAPAQAPEADFAARWILSRLHHTAERVQEALDDFRFGEAAQILYDFVWHEFCDWYIEIIKPALYAGGADRLRTQVHLLASLDEVLRLLHPFVPFLTEEIGSHLPGDRGLLLHSAWPRSSPERRDPTAETDMATLQAVIYAVRNIRGEMNVPPSQKVPLKIRPLDGEAAVLERHAGLIRDLARLEHLHIGRDLEKPRYAAAAVAAGFELLVPLEGLIDLDRERERLQKEIANLLQLQEKTAAKLSQAAFTVKAPPEVVEQERRKLADYRQRRERLLANLERLA